nr:PREDICTED: testis-expressed sequence 40 protein [Equus przewalskii]
MEDKPLKALDKSSGHRASGKSSQQDIRNLWTTATLSQPKLNVALSDVCEDSEGSSVSSRTRRWRKQTAGHDWDASWEALEDRKDKDSFKQEELDEHSLLELEMRLDSSVGSHVEDDDESRTAQLGSLGHLNFLLPLQLPLPLIELMENEALEILTKAFRSYRSGIGRDHFLTKQLQRQIEGLKRRQNKRLHVSAH